MQLVQSQFEEVISSARILIIGAAGSIGREVVFELSRFNPAALHCVDISENGLVSVTRKLRSTNTTYRGDYDTFVIDATSHLLEGFMKSQKRYDLVFNLAAIKHVRSEKDGFSSSRMLATNVLMPNRLAKILDRTPLFSVSTDKATNPVNLMGASKRLMELLLANQDKTDCRFARFANVIFSDGSLFDGILERIAKREPFSVPSDIQRYFMTPEEAGRLCLIAGITGNHKDIFFPKIGREVVPLSFVDLLSKLAEQINIDIEFTRDEEQVKEYSKDGPRSASVPIPVLLFTSDTPGEKSLEEFSKHTDLVRENEFDAISVTSVNGQLNGSSGKILEAIINLCESQKSDENPFPKFLEATLDDFYPIDGSGSLNSKM